MEEVDEFDRGKNMSVVRTPLWMNSWWVAWREMKVFFHVLWKNSSKMWHLWGRW